LSLSFIISQYYVNFVPHITNMLSPVTVFIATVFITSRLAARTEIIAILASGVSFLRLLVPYMAGAIILSVCTFFATGWLIPKASKNKVMFENAFVRDRYFFDSRNVHFKVEPNVFAYLQSYNNFNNVGYLFTLEKMENNRMVEKLSAERISWDTLTQRWHIDQYKLHTFEGDQERITTGGALDTLIKMSPQDFESTHLLHETFTLPELDAYIGEQLARGNTNVGIFLVEKYERYAYPFAILILTFMGVIVSARKSRQGTGLQIAIGFLLAFVFITLVRMFRSLGQADTVTPMVAAWIPTILFACIALLMYKTVPR
jgi:lipopolysaccharide export system permease protein